ncbi:hypothetical protein [Sporosarcina limicola]|uniref:Phosphoribosylanthranilate isomerase n=1 Tax=Sporosarcina limicola TaxID=34101 RepID=A0A927R3R8_9BACL|nr:hypothetical protein [Sporosarcina limicola]MBE1554043.1 hypothetical protein [Sporosarcina limicola]
MTRELYLYREFINISRILNQQLGIVPVLYGSLGLVRITKVDFSPQDIDILVPLTFLEEKWNILQHAMEQLGYTMVDLNEHEFIKNDIKIGFAFTEDLVEFADINYKELDVFEDDGAKYHLLTVSDYLKVYNKSSQDGYRRAKNNKKDLDKLEILNKLV